MARETMIPKERVEATLHLENPDRVPIVPSLMAPAAAHLASVPRAQAYADANIGARAIFNTFDDFGGWDAFFLDGTEPPEAYLITLPPNEDKSAGPTIKPRC